MAARMAKYISLINRNRLNCKFNSKFNSKTLLLSRYIRKYVNERNERLKWKKKYLDLLENERRTTETVRLMRRDYEDKIDNYLENIKQKNERLNRLKYDYDMICSEYDNVMSERDNVLHETEELNDKLTESQAKVKNLEKQIATLRMNPDTESAPKSETSDEKTCLIIQEKQKSFVQPHIKPFYSDNKIDDDQFGNYELAMPSFVKPMSTSPGGGNRYGSPDKLTKSNSITSSEDLRPQMKTKIPISGSTSTSGDGLDKEVKEIENQSLGASSSDEYDLNNINNNNNSDYTNNNSDQEADYENQRPRRTNCEDVVFINPGKRGQTFQKIFNKPSHTPVITVFRKCC